jgi:hypothetical protein
MSTPVDPGQYPPQQPYGGQQPNPSAGWQPPAGFPPPPHTVPGPKKRRAWVSLLGAFLLGLLLGGIGSCGADPTVTTAPAPTVTVTQPGATVTAPVPKADRTTAAPKAEATTEAPKAAAGIEDGSWAVGDEVKPGSYAVQADDDFCYFQTSADENGEKIDVQGLGTGRHRVNLRAGDYFQTSNCGTWQRVK